MTDFDARMCRTARAWLGWTQIDLAEKSGVGVSTIRDYERGARDTDPYLVNKLREALHEFRVQDNLLPEQVEWVVNNLGELGVKIGEQFFWLYKGCSLVYKSGDKIREGEPDEQVIKWRPVGKREFGETCKPLIWERNAAGVVQNSLLPVPYPYTTPVYNHSIVGGEAYVEEIPWKEL